MKSLVAGLKENLTITYSVISIVLYTLGVVYFWEFTIDDAYISLRYAENFSQGYGLVFNELDEPYEAYSNFLLVILESLLLTFGLDSIFYVKLISYLFGVATLILLPVIGNVELSNNKYGAHQIGFTQILLATSSPYIIWTVGGLETIQFTFVILASFAFYTYAESKGDKNNIYYVGDFFAVLAMLSRPEGLLLIALAITYRFFNKKYFAVFVLLAVVVFFHFWKYWYFGDLLASPYYAKAHDGNLLGGLQRSYELIIINFNIIYSLALMGGGVVLYNLIIKKSLTVSVYVILFVLGYTGYVLSLGYQVSMDDAYRYYVPILVVLISVMIYLFKWVDIRPMFLLVALAISIPIRANDLKIAWEEDINWGAINYIVSGGQVAEGLPKGHVALGKWLRENAKPTDTIVVHDAGAIPYFSKLHTIDGWSLTDKNIVRLNLQYRNASPEEQEELNQQKFEYLLSKKPDWIVQDKGILLNSNYRKHYRKADVEFQYLPWYKLTVYKLNN